MSQDMRYVKEIKLGGINVKKIEDINGRQLWPYDQTALNYFYFEGIEDGTEIGVQNNGGTAQLTARFWVSSNKTSWTQWGYHSFPTQTINRGEKLYIWNKEDTMTNVQFTTSKNVKCGGNVMSLLNWREDLYAGCFLKLLWGTKITTPPELPATVMASQCYMMMFASCTELTAMPALPAMTLAEYCYTNMFSGCTSLVTLQTLPATVMANYCYAYMFQECTSLTYMPNLPGTALANNCYEGMFYQCTSLLSITDLPAKVMYKECYKYMFRYCYGLTDIYRYALGATTLADNCFNSMFRNCINLKNTPDLNAISLVNGCYSNMFDGCTSLNYVFAMFTTDISSTTSYTNSWLRNVAATGNFTKNRDAIWIRSDEHGIPTGWTVWTAYPYVTATLFLQSDDCDLGKVNIESGPDVCNEQKVALLGDVVPIKAVPNAGVNFVQWSDGGTNAERNYTLLQDTNLIAFFYSYSHKRLEVNSNKCTYGKVTIGINSYSCSQYDYVPNNTYMTVKATPETGTYTYFFGRWSDGDMSNPRSVYMDDNKTLTAYFGKEGDPATFRVQSVDSNYGLVRFENNTYEAMWSRPLTTAGSTYEIAAEPTEGNTFDRWLYNGTYINGNPINVVLTDTFNVAYAYFIVPPQPKTLTVNSYKCAYGNVRIDNTSYQCTNTKTVYSSLQVEIAAQPETGYKFSRWNDGNVNSVRSYNLTENANLTAYFDLYKSLTVNSENCTYGKVAIADNAYSCSQNNEIKVNTYVNIKAQPETGYLFSKWNDNNRTGVRSIYVNNDKTYTASFVKAVNLDVYSTDTESGSIRIVGNASYTGHQTRNNVPVNSSYTFYAQTDSTSTYVLNFDRWLYNGSYITDNPLSVTLADDNNTAYAYFSIEQPQSGKATLGVYSYNCTYGKISIGNGNTGTCNRVLTNTEGGNITIYAIPNTGYMFNKWQDGNTDNPRTVEFYGYRRYIAYFK